MAAVEDLGGAVAAIEQGFQKNEIERSAYRIAQEIDGGERVVVGVNRFAVDERGAVRAAAGRPGDRGRPARARWRACANAGTPAPSSGPSTSCGRRPRARERARPDARGARGARRPSARCATPCARSGGPTARPSGSEAPAIGNEELTGGVASLNRRRPGPRLTWKSRERRRSDPAARAVRRRDRRVPARPPRAPRDGPPRGAHHRPDRRAPRARPASARSSCRGTGPGLRHRPGDGPVVLLRADIDALPLPERERPRVPLDGPGRLPRLRPRRAHRRGARRRAGARRPRPPRACCPAGSGCVFQPAEEVMPGGALDVIAAGGLDGVERDLRAALRPPSDVGRSALRAGADHRPRPTTCSSACTAPGGHTARPHLTADLVFALAKVVTELPAVLSRRVDPRAGVASSGAASGRRRGQRHPAERRARGHPALPRPGGLGTSAGALLTEVVHEIVAAVRRARGGATPAACRRWSTTRERGVARGRRSLRRARRGQRCS